MKRAIFPGSFDPFTAGHEAIVKRALTLFDEIIIGVGVNPNKKGLLSPMNRKCLIEDTFSTESRVTIKLYEGLTTEFCEAQRATHIIRGLRNSEDLEFERAVETINKKISPNTETIYILTASEHLHISSSAVREMHHFGCDVSHLMPTKINLDNYL